MATLMASMKNKSPQATSMEYVLPALLVEHAGEAVPRAILLMLTREVDMHIQRSAQKTGSIRRPLPRNSRRCRIPFPAPARA